MESTTAATALTLHAYYEFHFGDDEFVGAPQHFEFQAECPTHEDATALVAQFPKSCKMYSGTISNGYDGIVRGWASSRGSLLANGVNHGINESALRRYQSTIKAAAKLGIEIAYKPNAKNSYPTREAFEAAIGL